MSGDAGAFFTPAAEIDAPRVLSTWGWFLRKPYRVLGMSTFGDLFLEAADGSVATLDIVTCEVRQIAACFAEFEWGLSDPEHQEEWLMAGLCRRARDAGIRHAPGQCLAFQTPPILGGLLATENLIAWDLWAYYEGLAKLWPQVLDLPLGTEVVVTPSGDSG